VRGFAWQTGYGGFSVGAPKLSAVIDYIRNQRAHHMKCTYEEEFIEMLRLAGINFDPMHVFD
jgi:hypothetical protein